jgi:mono/diheme cytochrome c family protein
MKSLIASAVLLMFVSPALMAAPAGDATVGKDVYTKRCAICHGDDGSGDTPMAAAFGPPPPPDFRSKTVQSMTDAQITNVVKNGKDRMPKQTAVNDDDIANIIAYIRTLPKVKPMAPAK